jgi:hypothetical protein
MCSVSYSHYKYLVMFITSAKAYPFMDVYVGKIDWDLPLYHYTSVTISVDKRPIIDRPFSRSDNSGQLLSGSSQLVKIFDVLQAKSLSVAFPKKESEEWRIALPHDAREKIGLPFGRCVEKVRAAQ